MAGNPLLNQFRFRRGLVTWSVNDWQETCHASETRRHLCRSSWPQPAVPENRGTAGV